MLLDAVAVSIKDSYVEIHTFLEILGIILNLHIATGPIVRCEGVSDGAQLIRNKASAQSNIAHGEATALRDDQYCSNCAILGDGNSSRFVSKR